MKCSVLDLKSLRNFHSLTHTKSRAKLLEHAETATQSHPVGKLVILSPGLNSEVPVVTTARSFKTVIGFLVVSVVFFQLYSFACRKTFLVFTDCKAIKTGMEIQLFSLHLMSCISKKIKGWDCFLSAKEMKIPGWSHMMHQSDLLQAETWELKSLLNTMWWATTPTKALVCVAKFLWAHIVSDVGKLFHAVALCNFCSYV